MILPMIFHPLHRLTDEELMERVTANDDDRAYDELYHRHARRLMGFFYRQMNHDQERASDMMQDTFLRAWANRQRWKTQEEFLPWLFTIAFNICKNEYRHDGHRTDYEQHMLQTQGEDYTDDAELEIDARIFDKALQSLLDTMPCEMRTLFSLRFEEELTIPQISDVMNIPQGTVKSRLHTLTRTLKEKLKQYGNI